MAAHHESADLIHLARAVWGEKAILPFVDLEHFAALVEAEVRKELEAAQQQAIVVAVLSEREACADLCSNNVEELCRQNGKTLGPWIHDSEGSHSGMTYAKAIRNRTQPITKEAA